MKGLVSIPLADKEKLEVLSINENPGDCAALRSIMGHTNWVFHCEPDLSRAMQFLATHFVPVVTCSKQLPGGTWEDVVAAVRRFANPPEVLVYARQADEVLWMQVLNAGAYDLLRVPFEQQEVLRVISLAYRAWKDRAKVSMSMKAAS